MLLSYFSTLYAVFQLFIIVFIISFSFVSVVHLEMSVEALNLSFFPLMHGLLRILHLDLTFLRFVFTVYIILATKYVVIIFVSLKWFENSLIGEKNKVLFYYDIFKKKQRCSVAQHMQVPAIKQWKIYILHNLFLLTSRKTKEKDYI